MTAKIAVGTSAFAMGVYAENPIPFEQVVMRLAELGYDGLELPAIDGYGSLQDYPDTSSRQKLINLVRSAGLEISSYGADLSPSPFYSAEPDIRVNARTLFDRAIAFCLDCDIQVIRVDTLAEPPHPPGVGYDQAWQRTVEMFRYYAETAQRHEIVVAWEFEPGFMFNKPSEILGLVKEVDHPNFTVMYDSCHAHMCAAIGARQEPPQEIMPGGAVQLGQQLHGHIGFVHLIDSDNTLHDGITSTHAPFGAGVLDFPKLVQTMLEAGYQNPWWTIDLCFWPGAWQELEPSLKYVQNLLEDFDLR